MKLIQYYFKTIINRLYNSLSKLYYFAIRFLQKVLSIKVLYAISISLIMIVSFKLPLGVILNIFDMHKYVYPIVMAITSTLIYITKVCFYNNENVQDKHLFKFFLISLITSYTIYIFIPLIYSPLINIIHTICLPFYIDIRVTNNGLISFSMEGNSQGSNSNLSTILEKANAKSDIYGLFKSFSSLKIELNSLITDLSAIKQRSHIHIIEEDGNIDLDVPHYMSIAEASKLSNTVKEKVHQYDEKYELLRGTSERLLERRQHSISLGNSASDSIHTKVDSRIAELAQIRLDFYKVVDRIN